MHRTIFNYGGEPLRYNLCTLMQTLIWNSFLSENRQLFFKNFFLLNNLKKKKKKPPRNKKQEHVQTCIWVFLVILVEQIFFFYPFLLQSLKTMAAYKKKTLTNRNDKSSNNYDIILWQRSLGTSVAEMS